MRQGVKWHDGKPFTAADVKCTWDLLPGKASEKLRVNPRKAWYRNLEEVTTNGDYEVDLSSEAAAAVASWRCSPPGASPVYPCHVPPREMRQHPIGTGPFKFVEFKPNEVDQAGAQPGLLETGPALSRWHRVHDHHATSRRAILAFVAGKFDMTFAVRHVDPAAAATSRARRRRRSAS